MLFPRPSPLDAPLTSPAISIKFKVVGITFLALTISCNLLSLESGTSTIPIFGSIVQKGKFAAAL